jgi:hypothetical protein
VRLRPFLAVLGLFLGLPLQASAGAAAAPVSKPASMPASARDVAGLPPCSAPVRFFADWFPDPPQDMTQTAQGLARLGAPVSKGMTALGLVTVDNEISVTPEQDCRGLAVRLSFVKPVLRVASELPPDTCAHEHVLRHEYTHVRIYREMARQFRELVYPFPDSATSDRVLRYARAQLAKLQEAQRQFDSPQEYAGNTTACRGEIPKLLAASRKPGATPG